jgi:uncharacterized protein (DUF1800 family)
VDAGELAHLLRRTEVVARPERMAALASATRAEAVDAVMAVGADPVVIPSYIDHDIDGQGYDQWVFAVQWWMDRFVDAPTPMHEKMTLFWHGHFCSSWDKVNSAAAMLQQHALFRTMAFGNFRTLVQAMSVQPAMLKYLDNVDNVKSSPNQNFARELMELFTLGVGNYTENDVTAAARAWTGHGVDNATDTYLFRPNRHDTGMKTFMGVTRNWDGPDIVNHLLRDNATTKLIACRFLTRKLWTFFAHDDPSATVVDELARVLFDADFEMAPWVRAMLLHDAFYSTAAKQGMVRSPVEYLTAIAHHTGLRSADLNPQWSMEGMGQVLFNPPNVAGWKTNGYWVNTGLFAARAEVAQWVTWRLRDNDANDIAAGRTPEQAVDEAARMFGLSLSTTTRAAMAQYCVDERLASPWSSWWESTNLLVMAMTSPEMHLA